MKTAPSTTPVVTGHLCLCERAVEIKTVEFMQVTLQVPPSAAAIFPAGDKLNDLRNATAFNEKDVALRVSQWKNPYCIGVTSMVPAKSKHLAAMKAEGCTASAAFRFPAEEWQFIERIALQLKITVGDYLLGCVGYAVWLAKQEPTPTRRSFTCTVGGAQ